jgi:ribonuclease HI
MDADVILKGDIAVIAAQLGVEDWDVALVGDGAGISWDRPAGWACVLIDRHGLGEPAGDDRRKLFTGGMNYGTIGIAELMAYIHALLWYERYHGRDRRLLLKKPLLDVLIITDRQGLADQAVALSSGSTRASTICKRCPLWAVMLQLARAGYRFTWRWQPRRALMLNSLADRMADAAKHAGANALVQALEHVRGHEFDPSDEELIYLFNRQASILMQDVSPPRRKRYNKRKQS